jgi:hypothetical protein
VAKSYGDRKGITYSAWRKVGVSAPVLQQAKIARTRGWSLDDAHPIRGRSSLTGSDSADAISLAALVASVGLALWSLRISRKALRIAEDQDARRTRYLEFYLNESVSWRLDDAGARLVGFHLMVTNPADRPNSVVRADLHVTYSVGTSLVVVQIPCTTGAPPVALASDHVPLGLPLRIGAKSAVSGWFLFRLSKELTGGHPIERYDVVLRDVIGIDQNLQVMTIGEEHRDESG